MKKFLLIFMTCVSGFSLYAQHNDAQLWENVNIEKNINPRMLARINQEGRFTENMSTFTYNYLDIGLVYKFSKHVHGTIAYVWNQKMAMNETWNDRHQFYADITLRKKLGNFMLNDRQMILWQTKDFYMTSDQNIPDYYLRNKATIRYEKIFKFQPYVAAEIYYKMNFPQEKSTLYHFNHIRYFAGLYYNPSLINQFEVYYLIENHFHENDPITKWVIGLGYSHTF